MPQKKTQEKIVDKLTLLCSRGQELSSIDDMDILLERILQTATEVMSTVASSIYLTARPNQRVIYKAATGKKASEINKIDIKAIDKFYNSIIRKGKITIINDIKPNEPYLGTLNTTLKITPRNIAIVPIHWESEVIGILEVINKKHRGGFKNRDFEYLSILANQAGSAIYITSAVDKLQNFFVNMLEILMMATETLASSPGHSVRVARLATKIAREMKVEEDVYNDIYYASLIHDIGQIRVARDQIVGGERLVPTLGSEMIRPIKILKKISKIIECHHERWDGSGHPKGLIGEDIPLAARIIALAEEYEEWKEEETYRKQFDPNYSDNFFKKIQITHDPNVVEAFKKVRKKEMSKVNLLQNFDFKDRPLTEKHK